LKSLVHIAIFALWWLILQIEGESTGKKTENPSSCYVLPENSNDLF